MKETFITITGLSHYLGTKPFKIGRVVKLIKEKDNDYDSEAIRVELPYIDTIGYVANNIHTVYEGTDSAGRLYDKVGDISFAKVMFITHSSVIAKLLTKEEAQNLKKAEEDFFECTAKKTTADEDAVVF